MDIEKTVTVPFEDAMEWLTCLLDPTPPHTPDNFGPDQTYHHVIDTDGDVWGWDYSTESWLPTTVGHQFCATGVNHEYVGRFTRGFDEGLRIFVEAGHDLTQPLFSGRT